LRSNRIDLDGKFSIEVPIESDHQEFKLTEVDKLGKAKAKAKAKAKTFCRPIVPQAI
jgi:hypothetical protein